MYSEPRGCVSTQRRRISHGAQRVQTSRCDLGAQPPCLWTSKFRERADTCLVSIGQPQHITDAWQTASVGASSWPQRAMMRSEVATGSRTVCDTADAAGNSLGATPVRHAATTAQSDLTAERCGGGSQFAWTLAVLVTTSCTSGPLLGIVTPSSSRGALGLADSSWLHVAALFFSSLPLLHLQPDRRWFSLLDKHYTTVNHAAC